jgi:serine/threonine protein kinase
MRDRTSVAELDSAEAGARPAGTPPGARRRHFREVAEWKHWHSKQRPAGERPSLTVGNVIHFIIAVFFLWPIFVIIAAIWSLGDAVNFLRHTVEACISSTFWLGRLSKEWLGGLYLHKTSPQMLRLRGQRRAFGHEAGKDWANAGKALVGIGRAWSKTFGLGGLFSSLERRIERSNLDWRRYVATAAYDNSEAPADFPSQYIVIDELPPGGSTARLYVVRKAEDAENGPLYVLKYFNLRACGNLEAVIRESQAAQLAQKLGLIIESKLAEAAFWYVMPYYRGETLTGGVMRNIKQARESNALTAHYRISLGYTHQLLQIIAQYHEAGVFHKDIKPDNLIINGERIYLVDIGLMTPLGSMSQLTTHGTEYFRDPEMVKLALEGREVREVDAAKFDVYSIGAVMFFALSGEFPTSGALSRLPNEVPMATQWVVNRAMTGMHQRYADARAMLTDIDYLCWAASQGQLDSVKPADLPSFKGMPVPLHLQPQTPNTEYRERLAASPGGYGAWYAAPLYERPRKGLTVGKAAAILMLVGGLSVIGLVTLGVFAGIAKEHRDIHATAVAHENLADRLPAESQQLRPLFEDIDAALNRGVDTDNHTYREPIKRIDLVPALVKGVDERTREWEAAIARDLRKRKVNNPGVIFGQRQIIFLSVDTDEADIALARGIEHEFEQEAARQLVQLSAHDATVTESVRNTVGGISDKLALHRELSAECADAGRVPAFIVVFTIEHENGGDQIHLRAIYPGREYRAVVPIGERAPDRGE